jgi:ribonuclease E
MRHPPLDAPTGAGQQATFPPADILARRERSDPLMDQEPTSVAESTGTPDVASTPTMEGQTTTPRRRSEWGKVQVKPRATEPPAEPAPERAPEKAATVTPAATETPAVTERPATRPAPRARPKPEKPSEPDAEAPTQADAGAEEGDGAAAPAPRRRRRGGRGRGGKKPAATDDQTSDDVAATDAATETEAKPRTPRQRSNPELPADEARDADEANDADRETATDAPKKRRRRGGRGRGGKKTSTVETPETQRDDATPDASAQPAKKSSRSRSGAKKKTETGPKDAPATKAKPKTVEEQIAAGGPTRGIRTTRSRTGRDGRRRREPMAPPPRVTDKVMVITEHGERDQIAVLEENVLVQHYVTRAGATSMVGNVYLGRVQNVLPGMEAAFVDVGRGRNGVLYAGEVNYSPEDIEGPAPRIEQMLKPGQAVMVQVTKDPMGGKGARLTANLSLAGRYLVLAPNQNLQGISRRLGDDARKRLKSMLKRVKPPEHGVIVRTAAEGVSEEALEADLRRLLEIWDDIQKKAKKGKAPTVLYEEPELTVRVVRDLFTDEEYKELATDSQRVYDKIRSYLGEVAPDLAQKITLHDGKLPAFEEYRIVEQIHKALDKKVWLPSGGYLFIERTEAMTIIDVNTGKSVGKTNLEATVVNTNLEAAAEVARQLRLRDIGGIIVIDFIDMLLEKNKKQVEDTMREALAIDKTRSQVFEIGPLGLMQVTRKRVSSGLVESFSETCPTCEGRGIILTYDVD